MAMTDDEMLDLVIVLIERDGMSVPGAILAAIEMDEKLTAVEREMAL
jgi:hypothetical protein